MADGGLLDALAAPFDAGASLLTGAYGQVDALANQGLLRALGGSSDFAEKQAERIQAEDTYRPRTYWGARALGALGNAFASAADSAPAHAIADPISNALLKAGVQPGDLAGLTGAVGLLVGGPMDAAEARLGSQGARTLEQQGARFADYADRYPPVPQPVDKIDKKTGNLYSSRGSDELSKSFMEARADAQKDIDAGNYKPYFDVESRYNADPSSYAPAGNTLTDTLAKKQATIDKQKAAIDTPEARERLNDAFNAAEGRGHDRWYAMGQLQDEYVDELGQEEGLKAFKKDFADAMAATTAGQSPTPNLLMAHYGNFLAARGLEPPPSAHIPYPVSGQYMANNLAGHQRMLENGGMTMASPKGHNFSRNLLGDMGPATIDTRMSGLITPGTEAPPKGTYGIYENMVREEAAKRGLQPANFQDVAWAGGDPDQGMPMIQHVNEAIERTSRLTGLTPRQVVRQNLIRKMGPIFGLGGAGLLTLGGDDNE